MGYDGKKKIYHTNMADGAAAYGGNSWQTNSYINIHTTKTTKNDKILKIA